ncbi:MAG: caspase family protein [Bacteroidota bacterium]
MSQGISLHIGLNILDSNHYNGWDGRLWGSENDAIDMSKIGSQMGYSNSILLSSKATRNSVISYIKNAAKNLNSGDIFFISYSGHGTQLKDLNNDETDGKDEAWCLYDGMFIDDELYNLWTYFKTGVRIILISDSCCSGTMLQLENKIKNTEKFFNNDLAQKVYLNNKSFYDNNYKDIIFSSKNTVTASVKLISACQENETTNDGVFNGDFTSALKKVWNQGNFQGNYSDFHTFISNELIHKQFPNLTNLGLRDKQFDLQKPFII